MTWIIEAEYVRDYIILLTFNDGMKKVVDLQHELDEGIFLPLKDKDFFKNFHIAANTVEWENGADFAPEFLRSLPEMKLYQHDAMPEPV